VYQFCVIVHMNITSWKKEGNLGAISLMPDRESGLVPGIPSHKGFAVLVL